LFVPLAARTGRARRGQAPEPERVSDISSGETPVAEAELRRARPPNGKDLQMTGRTEMKNRSDRKRVDEIIRILREEMPHLRERYGVRSLGVFGSYVRGEQRRRSDLDLLVEFDDTPGLIKFIRLENELSECLGIKVDLVMKDALKPRVGKRALSEVVPI
jgi:hypothetical protein